MAVWKVVLHRVVDGVRCLDVLVARGVIAKLEPPYTTEKGVEDALLDVGLSVHLFQCRVGNALQYLGRKLALRLIDFEVDVGVIKRNRRDDLTGEGVHPRDLDDLIVAKPRHVEVKVVRLQQTTPQLMAVAHVLTAVFYRTLPKIDLGLFHNDLAVRVGTGCNPSRLLLFRTTPLGVAHLAAGCLRCLLSGGATRRGVGVMFRSYLGHYLLFPALRLSAPAGRGLTRVLLPLGLDFVEWGVPLKPFIAFSVRMPSKRSFYA